MSHILRIDRQSPPLPLLITGIPGVPGYNALHYFQARYPGQVFGIRQADNTRLAGPGHPRLQRRGPARDGPAVRPLPVRLRLGLRRQLRLEGLRAESGPGAADQRRGRRQTPLADRARAAFAWSTCRSIWSSRASPATAATSRTTPSTR